MIVGIARTCGIQIVHTLDPEEHAKFMKQRKENYMKFREELQEIKKSKVLRAL